MPLADAAVEAARVRLRPIIMTSFAFILGVLPLVISHGAGAEMRRTLGTAVFCRHARRDAVRHLPDAGVLLRGAAIDAAFEFSDRVAHTHVAASEP